MNKLLLGTLVSALVVSGFASAAAPAPVTTDGGTVIFSGSVVTVPCAVDNSSLKQTVTLGQVPLSRLVTKGDTSSAVDFHIGLAGCDLTPPAGSADGTSNYTKAELKFTGTTTGDANTLALSSDAGSGDVVAKNVGIEILKDGKAVTVDGSTTAGETTLVAGKNDMIFQAAYVATDDSPVAGTANGTVNFQLTYE